MKKILALIFLIAWAAGELPRFVWKWPVTLLDTAVGLMVISGWIRGIRGVRRISGIGLTFAASWVLGLRIFSFDQSVFGEFYLLKFLGYLWVIVHAQKLLGPVKKFIAPVFWVFVTLGLLQYAMIPDTRFLLRYGWDEHYYRLIGTVLDPNYAGAMLGVIALFALDRFLTHKDVSMALLVAVSAIGLVLTFSRASWLATAIAITIYLYRSQIKPGMTMILFLLVFFVIVFSIAPKPGGEGVNIFRKNSILQRTESWRQALAIWRSHPLIGVGFNNYRIATQQLSFRIDPASHAANAPDSSWLLLLATTGVFGVVLLGTLTASQLKIYYNHSGRTQYNTFYSSLAVLLTVHSLFTNTLFFPPMLGLVALTLLRPSANLGLREGSAP